MRAKAEPGSYVYDRLRLHFYQAVPQDATRAELPALEREWEADREEMDQEYEPTDTERHAVALGLRWYAESKRFAGGEDGVAYPREGGLWDQPLKWVRGMETVLAAREDARRALRMEDAEDAAARRQGP